MTFDKQKIKKLAISYLTSFEVWIKTIIHAALGGAAGALAAHFSKPEDFALSVEGLLKAKAVVIFGAFSALLHLYLDKPTPKSGE